MTDENEASQEPILIMGFEPDPERTPEDVRQWYSQDRSEAGLAKAFAAAKASRSPKPDGSGCSSRLWNETDTATEAAGGYRRNRANPIPMPDPDRPTAAQIKEILPANRKDLFFWENR